MTVYTLPKADTQDTLVWDKDVKPWILDGNLWKEVTPNAAPATKTWKELLHENGPLANSQSRALQHKVYTGEANISAATQWYKYAYGKNIGA